VTVIQDAVSLDSVTAGYRKNSILKDISLSVGFGEIVALIGHNGAGKSTLLKCVFGLIRPTRGTVTVLGKPLKNAQPRELLETGVAYIPQGNRVFGDLTVLENLEIGHTIDSRSDHFTDNLDRVLKQFPALSSRLKQRAGVLSGGEKQMLALASGLILSPRLLIMDEPSLGLSPQLVRGMFDQIVDIRKTSRTTILIVEQKVREVLRISDRTYVLRNGSVTFSGPSNQLQNETTLRQHYF
jgi:branched-chain amino acid transport system ATP-binding protein